MKNSKKTILISLISALMILPACGRESDAVTGQAVIPAEPPRPVYESGVGKAVINEVMPKNKATIRDGSGEFSDWIEIQNVSGETLDLTGWTLNGGKEATPLDGYSVEPNQLLLVFAPVGKKGKTVSLIDRNGTAVDSCEIISDKSDHSLTRQADGSFALCKYPTPGLPNSNESFDYLQSSNTAAGPLIISEVCVENFSYYYTEELEYSDWVEIKNISDERVSVSGWKLTDDYSVPDKYVLPDTHLEPGEELIVFCNKNGADYKGNYRVALFSLDSDNDRIYLFAPDGALADYTPLKDIPYGMSYGRVDGENGFFYMTETPGHDNTGEDGFVMERRVAESPVAVTEDGVFEKVKSVKVTLDGKGDIYYSLDGSIPDAGSEKYTGTFEVDKTCIVRAVCVEDGAVNSRALTLSYIINEGDHLPVVSVVSDNRKDFDSMYDNGQKEHESPGVISYYGKDGTFTIGAGIKMHGFSTLVLQKKNLSFRFRGCYGQESLDFDLFGDGAEGGVTNFTNLLLRSGGDQRETIVKNEVCLNLAREFSDNVLVSRNKYVVVYINGEYVGIYSLMEKNNEQWVADTWGVSKSSVTMVEEPAYEGNPFYQEVQSLIYNENMADPKNYAKLCEVLDIDSLIDWTILEGVYANWDLQSGNLRYVKSTENDGKWHLVLYDLDNALGSGDNCFVYVTGGINTVGVFNQQLLKNEEYKAKFLNRVIPALKDDLSAKRIWAEYERLADIVDADAKKDDTMAYSSWQQHMERQHDTLLEDYNWYVSCARQITYACHLTNEQKIELFGDF